VREYEIGERSGSYVRIWNETQERPIGVGFLVDPRHVLTCAHVVGDALGDRDGLLNAPAPVGRPIRLDFVCKRAAKLADCYVAKVVPAAWHPQAGTKRPVDVAVLEIDAAVPLPPRAAPVRTCRKTYTNDSFSAYGIKEGLGDGTYVEGKFAGELSEDRIEVVADRADVAIRAGCSGAAVWNMTRRGVAGMIVEMHTETQGRIIPVQLLREVWPGMLEEGDSADVAEQVAGVRRVGRQLSQVLHTFDRKLQTADFELALDEFWDAQRSPVVCGILGIEDDRPILCRDRCLQLSLRERLERIELGGKLPIQKKIDWPDPSRGVPHALARLKQQVRSELKARDASAAEIRKAYNSGVTPWAFFSVLKESDFTAPHRDLLIEWIGFWREIGAEALNKPLAVFFLFKLEGVSREPVLLEQVFDGFGTKPFDYVNQLTRLHDFSRDDVMDWLVEKAGELGISSEDLNDRLIPDARKNLNSMSGLRLAMLENWIQNLQI
jgi:hypothetical protein